MRRLVLLPLIAAIVLLLGAGSAHAAAPPAPGFYKGSLPNHIVVALTVANGPNGPYVTRVGGICETATPPSGLDGAPITGSTREKGLDDSFLVAGDGLWGTLDPSPISETFSGSLDGDHGVLNISNNTDVVRSCDVAADPEHSGGLHAYPIAISRVADAPAAVTPGVWTRQEPGGQPGTFSVWGGGAFVGSFDGSPYIGQESPPQCSITPASLIWGTQVGADGGFSLPWERRASPSSNDPVSPTTGQLSGGAGRWTYLLDSPYIKDTQLSSCDPPKSTTVDVALTTPQGIGPATPVDRLGAPDPTAPAGTTATTTCPDGTFRTAAGPFVLCSTAKPKVSGSRASLSGRVTINGFLFLGSSGIDVDVRRASIKTRGKADFGVIVKGSDLRLARTELSVSAEDLEGFSLPGLKSRLKLGGLPIDLSRIGGRAPSVSIDLAAGSIAVSAGLQYRLAGATLAADGSVSFAKAGIAGELSTKGFSLPLRIGGRQLFSLNALKLSFDQARASWSVGGSGEVALPTFKLSAGVSGGFVGGRFDSLKLEINAGDTGVPGPYGTFFSGGSFDIAGAAQGAKNLDVGLGLAGGWPYKVSKAVAITFAGLGGFDVPDLRLRLGAKTSVTAKDTAIANGDSSIDVDFDDGTADFAQTIDVLGLIHGKTTSRVTGSSFYAAGNLSVEFGPGSEPIRFIADHWPFGFFADPPDHIGPLLSADAAVSDIGAGARTAIDVWKLKAGATVIKKWGDPLFYDVGFGRTRSIDVLKPSAVAARAGAGPIGRLRVRRGLQALVVQGAGSATAQLVLRDPSGRVVADTSKVTAPLATLRRGRVLVGRRGDRVGIIVRAPRAGRWRVQATGVPAPTTVTSTPIANRRGELAQITRVGGPGRVRAGERVRLRLRHRAGTTVQIRAAKTKRGLGVPLATAKGRTVRVRVPRHWSGRSIHFSAVTRRRGVPFGSTRAKRSLRVSRATVGRVGRVRVDRGRKRTVVSFRRGRGSARTIVQIVVRGRRWTTVARGSKARLRVPSRKTPVKAILTPVRRDGRLARSTRRTVGR